MALSMKSPFRTWSLRSRLVLGVVFLTAIGFIFSSIVARQSLQSYLLQQVDSQLITLSSQTLPRVIEAGIARDTDDFEEEHEPGHNRPTERPRTPLTRIPTSTSVTLLDSTGAVTAALGGDYNIAPVTDYLAGFTPTQAAYYQGKPFTIETEGVDLRALALPLPNGEGTVIAAQSLGDLNKTVDRLTFLFLLIGLLLLLLMALAARIVIKIGMRPLEAVEVTAEQIASGDLSARMPESNPHTEVGRLVTSLNSMLSRIESSFAARAESENKLRRFVADASHELRTPLTAIRGFSELYRQGAVTGEEPTRELLGRIEGESKRMGSLVEDLLLLARLDQAREMESKPVNLVEIVESAVASARVAGPGHPVTFTPNTDELFTLGDEARIHQVVANLLANARAHTPAGTKIEVSIQHDSDGIRISVSDNGPGLSPEDQERIFERFYRADPARVRVDGEGSGLGLSIVEAVMKAHGGTVSVDSELGKGATFTLFFPIAP
jgi:two-component system OmpR family sensor kinase